MQTTQPQKLILVITGMHRSGTSLTASLLQSAGVSIGKRLAPPDSGNVKGYFENLNFVRFHEEVLSSQGIREEGWTLEKKIQVQQQYWERAKQLVQENASEQLWGWKDPRTTLFLDFWADFIPEANFIFVYRSPWEVVDSLYRRGDEVFHLNPNLAIQVWMNYNQSLLDFYNRVPGRCVLLNLVDIIQEPGYLVEAIKKKFGVALTFPDREIYDNSILQTQGYGTHRAALIKQYFPEALDLYRELNAKAEGLKGSSEYICPEQPSLPLDETWVLQDWLEVRRLEKQASTLQNQLQQAQEQAQAERERSQLQLQQLHQQLQHTHAEYASLYQQLQHTHAEYERSHQELQHTQAIIQAMETSKFWKLRKVWFRLKQAIRLSQRSV